jgi:glycosyltransferase involved in cell wall biosynthesis
MPIIVQNEEKNLPRFIDLVINNPYIGRVIAIDGGSKDKTVKLLQKAGAEVYIHPYIKEYHEQQAMQRNISCSYVKNGENILIMDLDECFSQELKDYLPSLCEANFNYAVISRKTFNFYADISDPSKAIKDYPDFQPRFYKWDRKFKFVGGAHHVTLNCPDPIKIQKDIIHFEREGKDREGLEKQWAGMMKKAHAFA